MAQQGHPLVTLGGLPAKFVAYVPDAKEGFNLVVMIDGIVHAFPKDGKPTHPAFHLLLAPLGFCEGFPVFAGDKLITTIGGYIQDVGKEFIVEIHHNEFSLFKWPRKLPIVETRMTGDNLRDYFIDLDNADERVSLTHVANKAISRAIADGDVIASKDAIPTSLFVKLAGEAYNERVSSGHKSFTAIAEDVLKDYLEGLK